MMKKFFKIMSGVALCIGLMLCLSSCTNPSTYEEGYLDGYAAGHLDAKYDLSDFSFEMYAKGYEEAYEDFAYEVIWHNAVWYARKFSEWHPEEAMCVIDAYKNGERYYGKTPITDEDYKNAVESLYRYYEYFYGAMYEEDVECDYDLFD